jgi:DNA polymerase-3 subunit alpha
VAQIITFGTLQARAVLRDVGRVMQMPLGQVDRLAKMVPANPANPVTLAQAIEIEPRLREARDSEPAVARLLETCAGAGGALPQRLDPRRRRRHRRPAADELVPLYRDPRSDHAGHPVQHEMGRERRVW